MTLEPALRKFALTVHVIVSIGWVGIVAGFLALAVAGLVSSDLPLVRASYVAMDFTYRTVVIPLGIASLIAGVICSLGTWLAPALLGRGETTANRAGHLDDAGARPAREIRRERGLGNDIHFHRSRRTSDATCTLCGRRPSHLADGDRSLDYKPRGKTGYGARKLAGETHDKSDVEELRRGHKIMQVNLANGYGGPPLTCGSRMRSHYPFARSCHFKQ